MRILVVDAFTDRPFAGNPAGVCLLTEPADPDWMQRLAAEMRHSETAFVRPVDAPDADYELRWFTPGTEVALCGHATMASAHALFDTGLVDGYRPIRFQTLKSGVLTIRRTAGGDLEMDFPAQPATPVDAPAGLAAELGVTIGWTGRNEQSDLLVPVGTEDTVRNMAPDLVALGAYGARGIIVTAQADQGRPYDFVSRFFGGAIEVGEDPVTGSAHCTLAPFWAERLGRTELTGYQASERGGLVGVSVRGDRVTLTGKAVTILDGTLRRH